MKEREIYGFLEREKALSVKTERAPSLTDELSLAKDFVANGLPEQLTEESLPGLPPEYLGHSRAEAYGKLLQQSTLLYTETTDPRLRVLLKREIRHLVMKRDEQAIKDLSSRFGAIDPTEVAAEEQMMAASRREKVVFGFQAE